MKIYLIRSHVLVVAVKLTETVTLTETSTFFSDVFALLVRAASWPHDLFFILHVAVKPRRCSARCINFMVYVVNKEWVVAICLT